MGLLLIQLKDFSSRPLAAGVLASWLNAAFLSILSMSFFMDASQSDLFLSGNEIALVCLCFHHIPKSSRVEDVEWKKL